MKTFRHQDGMTETQTMTVGELRAKLAEYTAEMPVLATWEGVIAYIASDNFKIDRVSYGHPDDACGCLLIDVEDH